MIKYRNDKNKAIEMIKTIFFRLWQGPNRSIDITVLMKDVWDRFHVQAVFVFIDNEPWCRVSASVYNVLEDYEKLADAVLAILDEH